MSKWRVICEHEDDENHHPVAGFTVDGVDESRAREIAEAIVDDQPWEITAINELEDE